MPERTFTAIFQETDEGWIVGYCEELPSAIVQERTLDEARESMKEVIHELIEINREMWTKEAGSAPLVREELTLIV